MTDELAPFAYRDPAPLALSAAGHELRIYPAGADRLEALLSMIAAAEKSLQIVYYIFQSDVSGTRVRDALVAAARRGVKVHLLVDRFGSDAPDSFFAPIVDHGGRYAAFSPRWNVSYLIRNHQKFVIADGARVMLGGANVSDPYFAPPAENGWCDLGVAIEGPVAADFQRWFVQLADWTDKPKSQFLAIRDMVREWEPGTGPVRLMLGGPTRVPSSWARQVKRDLTQASRLDLVMAYFSPPRSFRRLIQRIAEGGRARLIMAGKSDNGATIGAARALYGQLLRSGARIYEFQPCKLHMKLIVADDVTYFGSANFDMRSIRLNLESMVRIEDAGLAAEMRKLIDGMEAASAEITRQKHRRESTLIHQIQWRASWFLVSVLDYTVTRRLNLGM